MLSKIYGYIQKVQKSIAFPEKMVILKLSTENVTGNVMENVSKTKSYVFKLGGKKYEKKKYSNVVSTHDGSIYVRRMR